MAKPDSNDRTAGFANCDAAAERRQAKFSDRRETASVPDASLTDSIALIADNDAELTAATAEAVERFGEFLTRFEHRRPGDTFAVKVPFTDDYGREYMWVMVTAVDGPY
ncbi:MAG: DUF2314 domain-containing protein, partial [Bacteroidales bacterium]|nr:DUF2314 domain-containing protein [Bacteroidales bacterium]